MMFKRIITLILISLLFVSCTNKTDDAKVDPGLNRVFHEIFVGSFSDSNNDGIGDLKGIINRLDYLEELGINPERFDYDWISASEGEKFQKAMINFTSEIEKIR